MKKFVFLAALAAVLTTGLMANKCEVTNTHGESQDQQKPSDQQAPKGN